MEDNKIVKSDLRRTAFTLLVIFAIFGVLYYIEARYSWLTNLIP